jgi:2-polyprenyl-3-methyl-5-hydroxy-6-metoxy-1,4-benzoquinol methylase
LKETVTGRTVLEVACGTGYWTAIAAQTAKKIVAIDTTKQMLDVAREKGLPEEKVDFRLYDAYSLDAIGELFDAGIANFWLSHVPKARLTEFLSAFHKNMRTNARIFTADNVYMPGIGGKLIHKPNSTDTFKLRQLQNGSKHEVLKNYYNENQLREILSPHCKQLDLTFASCFWWAKYTLA